MAVTIPSATESKARTPSNFLFLRRSFSIARDAWCVVGLAILLLFALDYCWNWVTLRIHAAPGNEKLPAYAISTNDPALRAKLAAEMYATHDTFATTALRWEPYVYWRGRSFDGEHVVVGPDGLRRTISHPPELKTPAADPTLVTIFCFGGSTMWGSGVRDAGTIPSYLAEHLSSSRVAVTNFGQLGYVSTQEMLAFELEIQRGNVPDIALFYDGVNDIGSALFNQRAGLAISEYERQGEYSLAHSPSLTSLVKQCAVNSSIGRVFRPRWDEDPAVKTAIHAKLQDESIRQIAIQILQTYFANLTIIQAIADRYGIDVRFYWQPILYVKKSLSTEEAEILRANPDGGISALTYNFIQQAIGQPGVPKYQYLGDLFDGAWGSKPAFFDTRHVSEEANNWIAARMTKDLKPLIDKRRERKSTKP